MKDKALKLAKECGATTYTNRHLPEATTVTFSPIAWEEFCAQALDSTLPVGTLLPTTPAQEPVATVSGLLKFDGRFLPAEGARLKIGDKLYTTPQQRPWVGLTDEEIHALPEYAEDGVIYRLIRAAEAALRSKNNGT